MAILVALASDKPVVGTLRLTGYGDIVARLSFQIARVVPVDSYIADKLEGIIELLVVLRQVSSHLQGRIHGQVQGQRTSQRDTCP